jgi:hypothetical protein
MLMCFSYTNFVMEMVRRTLQRTQKPEIGWFLPVKLWWRGTVVDVRGVVQLSLHKRINYSFLYKMLFFKQDDECGYNKMKRLHVSAVRLQDAWMQIIKEGGQEEADQLHSQSGRQTSPRWTSFYGVVWGLRCTILASQKQSRTSYSCYNKKRNGNAWKYWAERGLAACIRAAGGHFENTVYV